MKAIIKAFLIIFFLSDLTYALATEYKTTASQALVFDYDTGQILFEHNADQLMHPSSMTKVMTTYIAFEALKNGTLSLQNKLRVSEKAWKMQGSRMFLHCSDNVSVDELIKGIIVQSGNDASVVLAEGMFGDEAIFVEHMNKVAKDLGMKNTNFTNSSGLPDPMNLTTCRDLGRLSRALIQKHPEYYSYHAIPSFTYGNITQKNRNPLIGKFGVDGIKTGYTDAGGYGVILSSVNGDRRTIAIINGLPSEKTRAQEAARIITFAVNHFTNATLFKKDEQIVKAEVVYGDTPSVDLTVAKDINIFTPRVGPQNENIVCQINYRNNIKAPIQKGTIIGSLECKIPSIEGNSITSDLVAGHGVKKANLIQHVWQNIEYLIVG